MMNATDAALRAHLCSLLLEGNAHMTLDDAVADFPAEHMNTRPPHVSYTPWHLLEHIRIAQWDILDFIRNPDYKELPWPEKYWPAPDALADKATWEETLAAIRSDRQELFALVNDPQVDLYQQIPHGTGQTILREILLVADHNAYHIGEFAILRQIMQSWPSVKS